MFYFFIFTALETVQIDPCTPSPCGPNSLCQLHNDLPSCSCQPEFIGNPPNCRPECISNGECPINQACINKKCLDPCVGACGSMAQCNVINHTPNCACLPGHVGDPFTQCRLSIAHENLRPCANSPCGSNAVCRENRGAGACTCVTGYFGNPYEGCRPECSVNTDCPSDKICQLNKCSDPCPGTCGAAAECQVINHIPACTCLPGYTGNPFSNCIRIQGMGQFFNLACFIIMCFFIVLWSSMIKQIL